jgi:ribonuclease-3
MSDLAQLQSRLGYTFSDAALLRLALTHPSVAHEAGSNLQTNQRLEFLGDAVLQLILTRALYDKFPGYGEGPLTKGRATLVNRRMLADHARAIGIGEHLILSRGEEQMGGRHRPSAVADAFEALIGAIYLDGGLQAAQTFVLSEFAAYLLGLASLPVSANPKGELQEFLQSISSGPPEYRLAATSGPDHDRIFECTVHLDGVELARGSGKSKKEAEASAALAAFQILKARHTEGQGGPLANSSGMQ